MAGSLVSNNTTIKVNGAVSATASRTSTGTTNLYTAPSTGYAIVNVHINQGGSSNGTVDVNSIAAVTYISATQRDVQGIYVGPSQVIRMNHVEVSGGTTRTVTVTGVEFINNP